MRVGWAQANFNGGEWSPLAQGRVDLEPYRNGLELCSGFIPTQQGGLARRSGTLWCAEAADQAHAPRLQKFEFNKTQAYILEFGENYIRFFTNHGVLEVSGSPYEVTTTYTAEEVWELAFCQKADVLYITHPAHAPKKLQRMSATLWSLQDIAFIDGPYLNVNTTATTITPSGTTGTVLVTASSTTGINDDTGFSSADLGREIRFKAGGIWLWGTIDLLVDELNVYVGLSPYVEEAVPYAATGVANVSAGGVYSVSITDGGSGYGTRPPAVSFSGGGGSGAIGYAVLVDGVVTQVVIQSVGSGYTSTPSVSFTAPSAIVPSTTTFWRLGAWYTGNYPSTCGFHQDRLCFAGTPNEPGRLDCSNTGDYESFSPTNQDGTVVDSNACAFSINSETVDPVTWMMADEWGLLLGTTSGEWVVSSSSSQSALTPTNVNVKPLSAYGSEPLAPLRVGKATLFVQRGGRKIRETLYQFTNNTFDAEDISLTGEHRTKGRVKQMAVQLTPQQMVWVVTQEGVLSGFTYDRHQKTLGWHWHPLGGYSDAAKTLPPIVESVAVCPIAEGRDELWVAVKRYVNGGVKRTIEYLGKLWEDGDEVSDVAFLDAALTYDGAPTSTITGLDWHVGETVGVLADGAVHPDRVVQPGGTITLLRNASKVTAGFRYKSRGRTLRIEAGAAKGVAQGTKQRISWVVFRFFQTLGIKIGSDVSGNPVAQPFRTTYDPMGSAPALFTGDKDWEYESDWNLGERLYWETDDPYPCNILLITAGIDTQEKF